jgi:hypothetical protein
MIIIACSITKTFDYSIELPKDATLETAQKIGIIVWNDQYKEKVKSEFPYLSESQLDGLYINYEEQKSLTGSKIYIKVGISYEGEIDNVLGIVGYCRSIMEDAVNQYYQKELTS